MERPRRGGQVGFRRRDDARMVRQKRSFEWGGPNEFYLFPGEVEDGVWRIDVSPSVVGEDGSHLRM